jgi:hypothetical protein
MGLSVATANVVDTGGSTTCYTSLVSPNSSLPLLESQAATDAVGEPTVSTGCSGASAIARGCYRGIRTLWQCTSTVWNCNMKQIARQIGSDIYMRQVLLHHGLVYGMKTTQMKSMVVQRKDTVLQRKSMVAQRNNTMVPSKCMVLLATYFQA